MPMWNISTTLVMAPDRISKTTKTPWISPFTKLTSDCPQVGLFRPHHMARGQLMGWGLPSNHEPLAIYLGYSPNERFSRLGSSSISPTEQPTIRKWMEIWNPSVRSMCSMWHRAQSNRLIAKRCLVVGHIYRRSGWKASKRCINLIHPDLLRLTVEKHHSHLTSSISS